MRNIFTKHGSSKSPVEVLELSQGAVLNRCWISSSMQISVCSTHFLSTPQLKPRVSEQNSTKLDLYYLYLSCSYFVPAIMPSEMKETSPNDYGS